ncbi:MAG: serine/threonine protein kinase [Labilithrix sp.]|nr:serine/threonine protein kinase [Labilithrix sp.]
MPPSTPLRSDPEGTDTNLEAAPLGSAVSDTERPPSVEAAGPTGTNPFGPEPSSGVATVEATRVGAAPDPAMIAAVAAGSGPLRAALPRPPTAPMNRDPSSARLVAAAPHKPAPPLPSSSRMPVAAPVAPALAQPVTQPLAPSSPKMPAARVATMIHAGLPPVAPPAPAPPPPTPTIHGPATVPAPPLSAEGGTASRPDFVISVVAREGSSANLGFAPDVPLPKRCTACETRYPADFLVCPRDASPLVDEGSESASDPLIGKLLGETYQIIRVVGEGGMGKVYEARHLRLKERRFAVKTLHSDLAKNNEIVARFMREAESASSLSHPNVVDVFDVHHLPDGTPYFVGEFVEGEELATFIATRGPLEPRMTAAVGRQVCRALGVAHARGIVHRDMKPENIMLLKSSIDAVAAGEIHAVTVKVLDFGISKAGGSDREHLTRTGIIMGTPSYMAPEQARGKSVDLRADIYSTGAVLYYALTGRRPFDSEDPTSTISMVLTQDPPRPRSIDPRIPEAIELIVQKAMAKEARDRYQTMAELEKALAVFEDGGRVMALQRQVGSDPPVDLAKSSTHRAFDLAKKMFATSTPPPGQSATLARVSRPTITVASAVLGTWLVGGTTASLAGLVRVLHDGEITLTECVLLVVGCLFAAATPIALYVLHVRKVIWPNSVRALQLASDLKRTATAALVTYGGLSILARIGHTVLWRSSRGLASGWWDIALFVVSLVAAVTVGGFAPLVRNMRRRRSS